MGALPSFLVKLQLKSRDLKLPIFNFIQLKCMENTGNSWKYMEIREQEREVIYKNLKNEILQ